jgi:hypothetical protein
MRSQMRPTTFNKLPPPIALKPQLSKAFQGADQSLDDDIPRDWLSRTSPFKAEENISTSSE